jgi:hypothetical protein
MKYLKILGLTAVAAMAMMAFAGSASATALKGAGGAALGAGTVIESSLTKPAVLETTGGEKLNECTGSTLAGKTSNAGSATETVRGTISTLSWSGCEKTTTTLKTGELEIHWISGTTNGTVTGKNSEVTINGIFGSSCVYGTGAGTDLGVLNGGTPATIEINTIVPRISGGFLCPAEARWTAAYKVTNPGTLNVEEK